MGGEGKRGGRKPLPPAPQPRESWVPQTAARQDKLRFPSGSEDEEDVDVRNRAIFDSEIIMAAEKYGLPDDAPLWVAESMAKRDTAHQMTLPGFAISRWHMYHGGRPVVVAISFVFKLLPPAPDAGRAFRHLQPGTDANVH